MLHTSIRNEATDNKFLSLSGNIKAGNFVETSP